MRKKIVVYGLIALFILSTTSVSSHIIGEKNIISDADENKMSTKPMGFSDLGDLEFMWGIENATADFQIVGCECNGVNFFLTSGNSGTTPNKVYIFDFQGNYVDSFDQPGTTDWGWIDLAWDGQYFYGGTDASFKIDVFTEDGTVVSQITAPVKWPSGLAYDPVTDHLWVTDRWNDNKIYEIDMQGNVIKTCPNTKIIYGLAWDDVTPGGPFLWCSVFVDPEPQCTFHQFNPVTCSYTGVSFVPKNPGSVSNKACGLGFTKAWDTSAGILFGIQQCDTPTPGDQLGAYFICDIAPPVPDLDCTGSLNWNNVEPSATVTGQFQVGNIGETGSQLNWAVDSYPTDWGTWTFTPNSGTGVTDGTWVTIDVSVVAPPDKNKEFSGKIKIINSDDPTDYCEIDVVLKTPKAKSNTFIPKPLERFPYMLLILQKLIQSLGL